MGYFPIEYTKDGGYSTTKLKSFSIVIFGGDKFDMGIFFPTARLSLMIACIITQALVNVTSSTKGDLRNLENDVLRGEGIGENTKEIVRSINDS